MLVVRLANDARPAVRGAEGVGWIECVDPEDVVRARREVEQCGAAQRAEADDDGVVCRAGQECSTSSVT